ncbi:MAG: hypothetical protein KJ950_01495 [Proteobacteria bacterium]|nr:hypothetical protein [Pseudomonadota bacterium]MBU1687326.1 hypothetical protein [Pseudomonadota bacterium]
MDVKIALVTAKVALAVVFGYLGTGYVLSRILRHESSLWLSFTLSLIILYEVIFYLGFFSLTISYQTVILPLIGLCIIGAAGCRGKTSHCAIKWRWPKDRLSLFCLISVGIVFLTIMGRCLLAPLAGYDTYFRWDYLAVKILEQGNFDFYPPYTPTDFQNYFFPDGFPPLVSFTYLLLYAGAGKPQPALSCIPVALQFLALCLVCSALAKRWFGTGAATIAPVILMTSSLFLWSVAIGQETGYIALSLGTMLVCLWDAREEPRLGRLIVAGAVASMAPLSRIYGWAIPVCGIILMIGWRMKPKEITSFGLTIIVIALPWYLRNWFQTGNPVYCLEIFNFPINQVHIAIMNWNHKLFGVSSHPLLFLQEMTRILFFQAPLQLVFGLGATLFIGFRRGELLFCTAVMAAAWLASVGYTVGWGYSTRVLTPVLLLLSVAASSLYERLHSPKHYLLAAVLIGVALLNGFTHAVFFPQTSLPTPVWGSIKYAWQRESNIPSGEMELQKSLTPLAHKNIRILTDSAYAHVTLAEINIDVVPIWSPEVQFVFDSSVAPEQIRVRLIKLGINGVLLYIDGGNIPVLLQSPFYSQDSRNWIEYLHGDDWILYRLPDR